MRWCLLLFFLTGVARAEEWNAERFEREISGILAARCLECHSGAEPKGGLDLSRRQSMITGGESGPAVVVGQLQDSLLWQRIDADEMPPENPLSAAERESLSAWIKAGAVWGSGPIDRFRHTSSSRAGYDWWALQPLKRPVPPVASVDHPIDRFIQHRLQAEGLKPSPPAQPREIVRRLHFNLSGLPPTPSVVAEFVSSYESDQLKAVETLVESLLASRHFGERWGRHWLDVVRFGESQGFERDKLRAHSWPYRDWVIEAMNQDMPYDEFVRQQLAGDVLQPDEPASVIATGFLVAGPWDEVGQSMRSAAMKAVVRQDEMEDYVGTIGQTFLGLTVNCARCHDHKFDPIRQREYYQLAAAVGGIRHGEREVVSAADVQRSKELTQQLHKLQDEVAVLDGTVRQRLATASGAGEGAVSPFVVPVARWDFEEGIKDSLGSAHAEQHPQAQVEAGSLVLDEGTGYAATHPVDFDLAEKTLEAWVRLSDLQQRGGAAISLHQSDSNRFDAIVFAERQPGKWMAGSDFFKRTKDLSAPPETEATDRFVHLAISYHSDGRISCYRDGEPYGQSYQSEGPLRLQAGKWYVMFGLRTGGPNAKRQLRGRLETAQIYDRALTDEQVAASFAYEALGVTPQRVLDALTEDERKQREALLARIDALRKQSQDHAPRLVYVAAPQKPDQTYVLLRGNPAQRSEEVSPGGLAALAGHSPDFQLGTDATDAERRIRLANWITDPSNPLFSRVVVNRLWHYHFGVGLVPTPNDFGFNGALPSHPELIDWLAAELIEADWSLKHIHRLIVTSATYLQSSRFRADCAAIDADNRLLWRKSPQRLEAEALRDSILFVSGQLNTQYGGPPYRDFETFISNSQFYNMTDPDGPEFYRRTVYRTWIRSGRNHLLDAFDCPDPSTTAPKRAVTTTPIQSLALMNNSFVLRMAQRFADRVVGKCGDDLQAQLEEVYLLSYGRRPADEERAIGIKFLQTHGLTAFCRVVFNSNEFIYVD